MASPYNYDNQPVILQDQTTPVIIANFNQVHDSTALAVATAFDDMQITVDDDTGILVGDYIILFDVDAERFYFGHALAVAANVITLDTPLDFAFPIGALVDAALDDLSVNGSVTTQTFGLRGLAGLPAIELTVDITRILFQCITATLVDLSKFADIVAGLTDGLVLRHRDGAEATQNIFNVKTNGDMAGIMFDFEIYSAANPVQGVDGFTGRLTFASAGKIGVAVRLPPGEDLELIINDDLSTITTFKCVAEGHLVDDASNAL